MTISIFLKQRLNKQQQQKDTDRNLIKSSKLDARHTYAYTYIISCFHIKPWIISYCLIYRVVINGTLMLEFIQADRSPGKDILRVTKAHSVSGLQLTGELNQFMYPKKIVISKQQAILFIQYEHRLT